MALHEPWLQTPEDTVPLTGIYEVIKRFNRNTTWVATALLGSVLFAALIVAFQERHAKADDLTKEARQTTGGLLNANPAAISEVVDSQEKSTGEMTSAPFSNSNKWRKENISYTAATSH